MPWLRLLAVWVALVLAAGTLSQAAHFLLVPHVVCAEHGELLELDEHSVHSEQARDESAPSEQQPSASPPARLAEHEHCQVLARGQREQALPSAPRTELIAAAGSADSVEFRAEGALREQLRRLDLAPKTSPPSSPSC